MPSSEQQPVYRRVLLKLSGEALMGQEGFGIDPQVLASTAHEIKTLICMGVQVAVVVGGGNLFRGAALQKAGMDRVTGDQMGMLATVMNALALRDAFDRAGVAARVMSAQPMGSFVEHFDRRLAVRSLTAGEVVIFSAGTGNPFFTTDTAACLRGIEVGADLVIKATKVDGVYSDDPVLNPTAEKYTHLTYDQVLERRLGVMDLTAICLVREHDMPLYVFDMNKPGALLNIIVGNQEGTLVSGGSE
jgi:uridylate kinase